MGLRHPHLYLIGLTGNIGCGKSTVTEMLRRRGAVVCDADQVTRQVMQPGQPAYDAVVEEFGHGLASMPGGALDRAALGRIVFADPLALRRLEAIVHPATRLVIEAWLAEQDAGAAKAGQRQVAVVDAIRLIEGGYVAFCDAVWVVICDEREQVRRLVEQRGMPIDDAHQRIAAQPPQSQKVGLADIVIDNSGSLVETEQQVAAAWAALGIVE